ncbi:MAG: anti-sigma factor family protein, partial [Planctomycetota bacterium]
MICAKAKELLQPYSDGELAGPKLMEIEEHVGSCQTCGAAASRLKKNTAFLIARLELLRGKVDVDLSFLEAAVAEKTKKAAPAAAEKSPARGFPWYVPVAAIVVLAGVGWWFFRGGGEPAGEAGGGEAARVARGESDVPAGTGSRRPAEVPPRGGEPKKPDRKPYRPVPVRANVALLLPELLRT